MLSLLAAVAPASARLDATAIADRYVATVAPGIPNYCAAGNLRVTYTTDAPPTADGWANGWIPDGFGSSQWDHARCDIGLRAGLSPERDCWVRAHEILHFVLGPEHTGPLAPGAAGATACYPPPTLTASVRDLLPAPRRSWRVQCGIRRAGRRSCAASSPHAKRTRLFTASVSARGLVRWVSDDGLR